MAQVSITGEEIETVLSRIQTYVQTKSVWSDGWATVPYLEALSASQAVSPNIPAAQFLYRYGSIKREDSNTFQDYKPLDILNHYIRIMATSLDGDYPLWVGTVTGESYSMHGAIDTPQGDQSITAQGLEHLLDRASVIGAYTDGGFIDWCPAFNEASTKGGSLQGNRSNGSLVFSRDRAVWTNLDIISYMLANYFGLPVVLSGQADFLAAIHGIYNFEGLTVKQVLDKLIDRKRGVGWFFDATGSGSILLVVFSVFSEPVSAGEMTYQGNPNTTALDLSGAIDIKSNVTKIDQANAYSQIIIQGARTKRCYSASFEDGTLIAGWDSEMEFEYNNVEGEATENDQVRASGRFNDVYRKFKMNSISYPHPLLNWIPVWEEKENELPEYEPPMVFVKSGDNYHSIEKLSAVNKPPAYIQMLDNEKGFMLQAESNHSFAAGSFNPGENSESTLKPYYDYNSLIATVAEETDERKRYIVNFDSEVARTLVITLHDAEFWEIDANTVTGVDNGELVLTGGPQTVRDDSDKLGVIAVLCSAWYGVRRASFRCEIQKICHLAPIGAIITEITSDWHKEPVNTIVTSRSWDFRAGTTTLETGFIGIDFNGILDIPGMSDFRAVGRAFNRMQGEVDELKQRTGNIPARLAVSPVSAEVAAEAANIPVDFIVDMFDREDADDLGSYWNFADDAFPFSIRDERVFPSGGNLPQANVISAIDMRVRIVPDMYSQGGFADKHVKTQLQTESSSAKNNISDRAIYVKNLSQKNYKIQLKIDLNNITEVSTVDTISLRNSFFPVGLIARQKTNNIASTKKLLLDISTLRLNHTISLGPVVVEYGGVTYSQERQTISHENINLCQCRVISTDNMENEPDINVYGLMADPTVDSTYVNLGEPNLFGRSKTILIGVTFAPESTIAALVDDINTILISVSGGDITISINGNVVWSGSPTSVIDGRFIGMTALTDTLHFLDNEGYTGAHIEEFKAWSEGTPEPFGNQSGHGTYSGDTGFIYKDKYHTKTAAGTVIYNPDA